jgi:hypothetical protein
MNERIKDFYDQVGLDFENFQRVTVTKGDMEKFAELIVVECAKLLPLEMTHGPDGRPLEQVFKQHFGVEQ